MVGEKIEKYGKGIKSPEDLLVSLHSFAENQLGLHAVTSVPFFKILNHQYIYISKPTLVIYLNKILKSYFSELIKI